MPPSAARDLGDPGHQGRVAAGTSNPGGRETAVHRVAKDHDPLAPAAVGPLALAARRGAPEGTRGTDRSAKMLPSSVGHAPVREGSLPRFELNSSLSQTRPLTSPVRFGKAQNLIHFLVLRGCS